VGNEKKSFMSLFIFPVDQPILPGKKANVKQVVKDWGT